MEKYDIDEYIIDYEDGMDEEVLKCLAYINMNNIEEAKKQHKNQSIMVIEGIMRMEGKLFLIGY